MNEAISAQAPETAVVDLVKGHYVRCPPSAIDKALRVSLLVVEYRWGDRTDGRKFVRNSGVLLHAVGPDGGAGGTWMPSIECQPAQGCVGDLIPISGKGADGAAIPVRFTADVVVGPDNRTR